MKIRMVPLIWILLCAGSPTCTAQDAAAIMQKMIAAYQRLSSYDGNANVDVLLTYKQNLLQSQYTTNHMQFKRPNNLALTILNNGLTGTRAIYSDGTNLTVYDALPNHYTVNPTAPDVIKMLPLLGKFARVTANLDPLYFLSFDKLPPSVTNLKTAGSKIVNGHDCLLVTGTVPGNQSPVTSGKADINGKTTMHWTWYIDKQTFLLNKIEARSNEVTVPVNVRQKLKLVKMTIPVVLQMRHTITSYTADAALDHSVFVFKAPPGATEKKTVSQMLKDAH